MKTFIKHVETLVTLQIPEETECKIKIKNELEMALPIFFNGSKSNSLTLDETQKICEIVMSNCRWDITI